VANEGLLTDPSTRTHLVLIVVILYSIVSEHTHRLREPSREPSFLQHAVATWLPPADKNGVLRIHERDGMFLRRDMLQMWRRLLIIGMYYDHGMDVELQWTTSGELLLFKE